MAHTSIPRSPVYASPSCNTYVTWRNHGTHSNESCRTHQYRDHLHDLCMFHPPATCMRHDSFMSHVGASGVTHMHPPQLPQWPVWRSFLQHEYDMTHSCHTYEWVMSHIGMPHLFGRCAWRDSFMAHVEMSHVTHGNESCHTWKWSMAHVGMSHVTCRNSSCHKYRMAKMHRLPSLDRVISAKEPYN